MDKKEVIFEAALKLFVENGFHGTATGKIAQKAGIANGTLFNYFKTKDELVLALYVKIKTELADYVEINTSKSTDIIQNIKTQISSALFWGIENVSKFKFVQLFNTSPYLKDVDKEILNQQLQPHLNLIQKGINEGLLKELPCEFIYTLISSHTFGAFQYLTTYPLSSVQQHDIIQKTYDLIWNMIKK